MTQTQKSDSMEPDREKAAPVGFCKTDLPVAGSVRIRGVRGVPKERNLEISPCKGRDGGRLQRQHPSQRWLFVLALLCVTQLILIAGCHRGFYRRQADAEARRLIVEKHGPRWDSASGDIEINPLSRMFDPFSADHPPIPPDDPIAHQLMNEVNQKPGYPHWHANGDINDVANPVWRSLLPVNENDEVVVSLADAYRLALTHSTDLQQQRETLYLSALEVSIQRFGFDTQLFSGFNSFLTSAGRFQSPTGQSSTTLESSLGVNGNGLSASRMGITGANFVAGLANTILWEFSGNNTQSANSLINFSVIQPLLRDAGRERILESLTQSERTLLANVRQLERFRRGFYLEIATGRDAGTGTVTDTSTFLNQPGLAGSNVGGYLGLLQQKQQIKNVEFSVAQFEALLKQFRELFEKDRIDSLQVAQFESSVYNQQQSLLNTRISYQNNLDTFKILLGLPPDIKLVIEDPFLDGFDLIDDQFPTRLEAIKELRVEVSDSMIQLGKVVRQLYDKAIDDEREGIEVEIESEALDQRRKALLPFLVQTKQVVETIRKQDLDLVRRDIEKLKSTRPRRVSYLDQVKRDIDRGRLESQIEPGVFSKNSIPIGEEIAYLLDAPANERSLLAKLDIILDQINDRIERINDGEDPTLSGSEYFEVQEDDFVKQIPDLLTDIDGIILEMALLQATARTNTIEITDVNLDANTAFETARCYRRDWMNARTALVDNWRQIEFFADQLEAQVDLVLTGEIGNAGSSNPFRVRYEDGNIRVGFQVDAPIVRQSERNDYRAAQISYQQARRSYYQFADSIHQSLRQTVRNINQDKLLFELNRQNLQVNIKQVQLARANLVQPPRPGANTSLGDVTARNLTDSILGLTNAQNGYLSLWTEYEVLRRSLDFDMGTMDLDRSFGWVDPGVIDATIGSRVAAREGIASNNRFCCGMNSAAQNAMTEVFLEQEPDEELIEPAPAPEPESEPEPVPETLAVPEAPAEDIEIPLSPPEVMEPPTLSQPPTLSPVTRSSRRDRVGSLNPFTIQKTTPISRTTLNGAAAIAVTKDNSHTESASLNRAFKPQAESTELEIKSSNNRVRFSIPTP